MNIQESQIQALRALIEKSPPLLEQLQQNPSPSARAGLLWEAAWQAGIAVDAAAMLASVEDILPPHCADALSDAQLELVAGGRARVEPPPDSTLI